MNKKFADTPTKRFFKLGAMGAKVATAYTSGKIKQAINPQDKQASQAILYSEIGEQVAQTLGEMKGAAMKVGQIVSQFHHFFPAEFTAQLAKLQQQSPPMPYAVIQQQIRKELGFGPEQLFAEFEPEPFAAASIGQVHKALTHDGQQVILKVQYPGVAQSCRSDLVQLKRLFMLSGLMKVDKQVMDELFVEIEKNLMAELDYQQEAKNLKEFAAFHQDNPHIIIPQVIDDFSSERILCLSYEPGDSMSSLRDKGYSQAEINQLAVHLVSAIFHELLYHLRVHCDPHPGNFAFRKDGKVIIYDYGAVTDVKDLLIDQYIALGEAILQQNYPQVDQQLLSMGLRNPNMPNLPDDLYQQWYVEFIQPALTEVRPALIMQQLQPAISKNMKLMMELRGAFQPSTGTIFINRVLGGHFLNLVQMDTDIDMKPILLNLLFEET